MLIPTRDQIYGVKSTEKYLRNHYPDFCKHIDEQYDFASSFSEKLYCYFHNIQSHPKCIVCGALVKYVDGYTGYRQFCSRKCADRDPLHLEKSRSTCLRKYGVDHQLKNKSIVKKSMDTKIEKHGSIQNAYKKIAQKSKETNLERYGVEYPTQSSTVKEKTQSTIYTKYGVKNPMQLPVFKQKSKETCLSRYGVDYPTQSAEIIEKIRQTRRKKFISGADSIIGYTKTGEWIIKCPHKDCEKCEEKIYTISPQHYHDRMKDHTEMCTHILPIQQSHNQGTTLELFVRGVLDECGISYICNSKNIIPPHELDIYIPSQKIAIECNGCYWHSKLDKKYHLNKYKICESRGIKLITFWDDQIYTKPEIVKSIICAKLHIFTKRIYARCCKICDISRKEAQQFVNRNHLQAAPKGGVYYGLYYRDELVAVMGFDKKNRLSGSADIKNKWVLTRFCSLVNTSVIGAASKLFKHFVDSHNPTYIESFSSNDISCGNMYKKLGFHREGEITLSYWYIDQKTFKRYHRSTFTKQNLVRKGFDPNMSEFEIMDNLSFFRIYDSGHKKWVWIQNQ